MPPPHRPFPLQLSTVRFHRSASRLPHSGHSQGSRTVPPGFRPAHRRPAAMSRRAAVPRPPLRSSCRTVSQVLPLPVRPCSRCIPACADPGIRPTAPYCGRSPRPGSRPPASQPAPAPCSCPRRLPSGSSSALRSPASALSGQPCFRSRPASARPAPPPRSGSPSRPVSAQRTGSACPAPPPSPRSPGWPAAARSASHPGSPAPRSGNAHPAHCSAPRYAGHRLRPCTAPPSRPSASARRSGSGLCCPAGSPPAPRQSPRHAGALLQSTRSGSSPRPCTASGSSAPRPC